MPGIVGLITKIGRDRAEPQLHRMVEALRHEPFYEAGTWIDESQGVYVGWIARTDSFPGRLPLENERRGKVLLFSGEEFSDAGAKARHKNNGHTLSDQPGAYLVHLADGGVSFPACLNGRFHGLLSDRSTGTAMLFNDRFGMHRIYYHQSNDSFYFAAEAKAILAARPDLRVIDPRGLGELVSCGCVLENRTVFKDIGVLPPGSTWSFRNGALESKELYFEPKEWEDQGALDLESYYRQLREIFASNMPKYFYGSQPIAMSLTGGLDSRMIMAWHKAPAQSLPCFSFGGTFRDCQDVIMARQVARACGQRHQVIQVGNEFLANFPHSPARSVYLTDACVDVSRSSDLYINERARG